MPICSICDSIRSLLGVDSLHVASSEHVDCTFSSIYTRSTLIHDHLYRPVTRMEFTLNSIIDKDKIQILVR